MRPPFALFRIGFLAALISLLGCGKETPKATMINPSPTGTVPTSTSKPVMQAAPAEPNPLLKVKADVIIEAEQLVKDSADVLEWAKANDGKVFDMSGTVVTFNPSFAFDLGTWYIIIGQSKYLCAELHPMSKVLLGQKVVLRGRCEAGRGIQKWIVVRAEGNPPPTFAAEQLAKDLEADLEGTNKKLKSFGTGYARYAVFTGVVTKIEDGALYQVDLTPPGSKYPIICTLESTGKELAEKFGWAKVGKNIRIVGEVRGNGELNSGYIIPPEK